MRKKLAGFGAVVAAVFTLAAFSSNIFTYVNTVRLGPYYLNNTAFDSATAGQVGGEVRIFLAADSVRVGQVVYLSSKNTVKTSATVADYNAVMGVVVGGTRTSMQGSVAVTDTSTLVATAGQRVLVLRRGRFWVLDSTGGITPGTRIRPSGTAGRFAAAVAAIDSLGRVFGKTVDTTVSGKAVLAEINVR